MVPIIQFADGDVVHCLCCLLLIIMNVSYFLFGHCSLRVRFMTACSSCLLECVCVRINCRTLGFPFLLPKKNLLCIIIIITPVLVVGARSSCSCCHSDKMNFLIKSPWVLLIGIWSLAIYKLVTMYNLDVTWLRNTFKCWKYFAVCTIVHIAPIDNTYCMCSH